MNLQLMGLPMKQRALPVSLLLSSLGLLPLSGACGTGSSISDEADAASSSSRSAIGSTSSGGADAGTTGDDGGEAAVDGDGDGDGDDDDGGDTGADVTVPDTGATLEAATVDTGKEATTDDGSVAKMDAGEAGVEAGKPDATTPEAGPEAGVPCVNLTVLNYEVWCSVSVNGGDAAVADAETVCVPPGTQQLAATALQFFELGPAPWHDTAGDMGQGDPGTVSGSGASAVDTTTVVVGSQPKCVWVCCPFDDGNGCPTTDQCP
ncbi:MAG TPA: hypothetical protein VHS09_02450 [Polyangiaceae bacterium]|nr:hypothetical protein [Polyangiaceae bacterium]